MPTHIPICVTNFFRSHNFLQSRPTSEGRAEDAPTEQKPITRLSDDEDSESDISVHTARYSLSEDSDSIETISSASSYATPPSSPRLSERQSTIHETLKPVFSGLSRERIRKLPLNFRYTYKKSGTTIPITQPKICFHNRNPYTASELSFLIEHYNLNTLSSDQKRQLNNINHDLQRWLEKIDGKAHKTPAMERVKRFSLETMTTIHHAINENKSISAQRTYKNTVSAK